MFKLLFLQVENNIFYLLVNLFRVCKLEYNKNFTYGLILMYFIVICETTNNMAHQFHLKITQKLDVKLDAPRD